MFLKVANRQFFFILIWDAIVQLCCRVFHKAFLTDPWSRSWDPNWIAKVCIRNVLEIAVLEEDVTYIKERLASYLKKMLQRRGSYFKKMLQCIKESLASYLKKMLQRIKSVLEMTWRTCSNVSGTSWQLLEEDVTTYQERVAENAGKRTLLHPPTPPPKTDTQCAKVTTVPPLHGRRHQKQLSKLNIHHTITSGVLRVFWREHLQGLALSVD